MNDTRQQRMRGYLSRGALLSALLHGGTLLPLIVVAMVLGAREEAERPEEVDVSWQASEDLALPENLPPIEPQDPTPTKPQVAKRTPDQQARPDEPLPEPEPKPEDPPPEAPPPPPQQLEKPREKMVDLDNDQEVEPPPDAKYLAQKNNRAEKETRATDTNLEREQKGDKAASSPSDRKDPHEGDDENRIAELEDVKSKAGRQAPRVTPHEDPELAKPPSVDKRSVLAMREAERRSHEITPETVDQSLPQDPMGVRSLPDEPGSPSDKPTPGQAGNARKPRLRLTGDQLDYLFGEEVEAERALAQKERSKKVGKFTERLGRVRSALENFIPEVQPGNQTALNTRAAPFAVFLARMHRSIHKLWGFGFLEDLDRKPQSNPMNAEHLATRLEIVLNQDGTVDNVKVVRSSGLTTFDVAALDTIYSAGPYPDPPREIRSGNGKIYLHWTFHRDERQCATAFAEPFILDNAGANADRAVAANGAGPPAPSRALERLQRGLGAPAGGGARAAGLPTYEPEETEQGRPQTEAARRASERAPKASDPGAQAAAQSFFAAYAQGDVAAMLKYAAFPFSTGGGSAIKSAGQLQGMLRDWLSETEAPRKIRSVQVYSQAGLRSAVGAVPGGFEGDPELLFAVARVAGDSFIAVLSSRHGGWRVVGLVRA